MSTLPQFRVQLLLAVRRSRPKFLDRLFTLMDSIEIGWVTRLNCLSRHRPLRVFAVAINRAGNGWIYVPIAVWLLLIHAHHGITALECAATSLLIVHAVYPFAKALTARPRPFDRYPALRALCAPLDVYSFPSGHCMTACTVFVVVSNFYPAISPFLVALWFIMAWAQITCAHHYLSDLVFGAILGAAVSLPISRIFLS